jgi:hypothetical protein
VVDGNLVSSRKPRAKRATNRSGQTTRRWWHHWFSSGWMRGLVEEHREVNWLGQPSFPALGGMS